MRKSGDGYVLSIVYVGQENRSDLVLFDATSRKPPWDGARWTAGEQKGVCDSIA